MTLAMLLILLKTNKWLALLLIVIIALLFMAIKPLIKRLLNNIVESEK